MSTQTPRPRLDPETLLEMQEAGLSAAQIAARLGVAPRTVTRYRSRLGVTRPVPEHAVKRATPERLAEAAALLADGASRREVSHTLRMKEATLRRHFPDAPYWSLQEAGRFGRLVGSLNRIDPTRALRGVTETEHGNE